MIRNILRSIIRWALVTEETPSGAAEIDEVIRQHKGG
jgi:hypothetical protein